MRKERKETKEGEESEKGVGRVRFWFGFLEFALASTKSVFLWIYCLHIRYGAARTMLCSPQCFLSELLVFFTPLFLHDLLNPIPAISDFGCSSLDLHCGFVVGKVAN